MTNPLARLSSIGTFYTLTARELDSSGQVCLQVSKMVSLFDELSASDLPSVVDAGYFAEMWYGLTGGMDDTIEVLNVLDIPFDDEYMDEDALFDYVYLLAHDVFEHLIKA